MEKLFIYPQSRHFDFDVAICKVIFRICTLTWCVNIYFSARKKDKRRNESRDLGQLKPFFSLGRTDDNNQYWYFHYYKTVKQQIDFSSEKQSFNIPQKSLPVENGNSWKQKDIGSVNQGKFWRTSGEQYGGKLDYWKISRRLHISSFGGNRRKSHKEVVARVQ